MNPINDFVCSLLETPFSQWKEEDRKDILMCEKPTPYLEVSVKRTDKKSGRFYNRHFRMEWYKSYAWLCGSFYLETLFCWPCLLLNRKKSSWCREGFSDFANTARALRNHEDSAGHLKCRLQLKTLQKNKNTVADALAENFRLHIIHFNENVRLNRIVMKLVIDVVLHLGKQELAFHGHDESITSINRGNFEELLVLLVSRSPLEIQNQYTKIKNVFSEDSKAIQNEVIQCVSEYIQDYVKNEINNTTFFSVQVDDITDISQTSQCSVIVRYINSESVLVERFLGFHGISAERSAQTLFSLLDSILKEFDYKTKLIGQCYDGASVMSGHLNGLQKKIKDEAPQAVFVHCLAHQLNLVLQQSLKKISKCRIFFANIDEIPSFFHHSAKRTYVMSSTVGRRIPTVTDTRWSSNSNLLSVIVEEWNSLKNVFETIIDDEESDQKAIQLSDGFLNKMNNFEFTFLAIVFNDIFELTDTVFDVLQKNSFDIISCISQIENTCEIISSKRNEQFYETLFEKAKDMTYITKRREYRNLSEEEVFQKYKILFYEILDNILMEMRTRFQDSNKLQFLCLADTSKFENYSKEFPEDALNNLQECYSRIFVKMQRLKNELSIIYRDKRYRNLTIENVLQILKEDKDVLEEAYKLFCLVHTIPSTSVSVERSFSCLNRMKTYLRNTISQERLSSLANIATQGELLCELIKTEPVYDDITDRFASLKNRRIDLIYEK